ncbi:hypothetical protein TNIN_117631, partial [Trichonephila inaurata madagascariensis]
KHPLLTSTKKRRLCITITTLEKDVNVNWYSEQECKNHLLHC